VTNRRFLGKVFSSTVIAVTAAVGALACSSGSAFAANATIIAFDFDAGIPTLIEGQNTPLDQTLQGVTAHFSSPSDPNAFSIQSYTTTFFKLSEFVGKYLYDNKPFRDSLDIAFSRTLKDITLTFATVEYHGGPGIEPSNITLTAYMNSTANNPVGSVIARATWPSGNTFPQGTLSFSSKGQPFNLVRVQLPYGGPEGAMDFLIDNVVITLAASPPTNTIPEFPFATVPLLTVIVSVVLARLYRVARQKPS